MIKTYSRDPRRVLYYLATISSLTKSMLNKEPDKNKLINEEVEKINKIISPDKKQNIVEMFKKRLDEIEKTITKISEKQKKEIRSLSYSKDKIMEIEKELKKVEKKHKSLVLKKGDHPSLDKIHKKILKSRQIINSIKERKE